MTDAGASAFGSLDGGQDGRVVIDCVISLAAIQAVTPEQALCNLWLDEQYKDEDGFKRDWQAYLKAYNLLQFLPATGFTRARGVQSDVYEVVTMGTDSDGFDRSAGSLRLPD